MNRTSEFSFILKPSTFGVGVFAVHDIDKGTHLRLFGDKERMDLRSISRPKNEIPLIFQEYCLDRGDSMICPEDFGQMHLGWYLNHSSKPNAERDDNYKWYATKDIKAGEEITVDYNFLEEPPEFRADYYNQ